jgi:predicted unusual protein kinase regulating ubiquinone biosynthesis (AarF/ABC1/UbiB family)
VTLPRLFRWTGLLGSLLVWSLRGLRREAMPRSLPERLGRMKGLPQKLGQFLAYTSRRLDDFSFLQVAGIPLSPDETRAAFGARLARYDAADPVPISAASICQVHRARLGGEEVVVKLLYPGIERALALDHRVARTLLTLLALPLPRVLAEPLRRGRHYLDVLEQEMRRECDLPREADALERFAAFLRAATFPEARFLAVPGLRRDRSDARALVMQFVEGEAADQFLRRHPRLRNRFRQLLFAFHRHALFDLGLLHADPHPGNFLCREAAGELHVTIVDFGCATSFTPELRAALAALIDAVAAWDDAAVAAQARALGFLPADLEALGIQLQLFLEVILAPFLAARRGAEFDWDEWRLEYKLNMLASSRSASYAFTLPDPLLLLLRVLAALDRYR